MKTAVPQYPIERKVFTPAVISDLGEPYNSPCGDRIRSRGKFLHQQWHLTTETRMESSVSVPMEMVPRYPIKRKVSAPTVVYHLGEFYNSPHGDGTRSRGKSLHQQWHLTTETRMESSVSVPMEMVPRYPIKRKVSAPTVVYHLGEFYNSPHGDGTRSRGKSLHQQCI
ncbi:hypothetical protein BsWGS_21502 [Bradybaena similaris]